ncbi:hypothetical protein [Mycoplasmopsis agassizii]|uniref:Uncharacterized protein n=1 Tax=Mycoplasmopsis agassizii TaxID=33922 RepID=A0ABX4H4Y3_9BACT|nr:hypothetical protein [Mycoplasmopsis agassizii]PAF54838.1 hypothetical protein CJF60_03835 [Mycoplasmopsis agassizii]SMC18623.1 hypothetical protein SAMN02745179_00729 [Mycoplasmopsis agassizii]
MKKSKIKPKIFLGLLISGITVLSIISGVSAIDNQQKVENNQTDSEKNLLLKQIKKSDSFENVLKVSFAEYKKYESSKPNSTNKTAEITPGLDAWMPVTISNNDETRKKELDVVFTY